MMVCLLIVGLAHAGAQDDYTAGIAALRAGEDAVAVEKLSAALAAGGQDPAVYHALGNALYRQDRLGEAMAAWRRGLVLDPGDGDLTANLERARAQTKDRLAPPAPDHGPFFWQQFLSRRLSGSLASLAATLGMVLLVGVAAGRRRLRWPAVAALGAAGLLAASTWQAGRAGAGATVIVDAVSAHSTPADGGVELFVLHEGAEVRLVEEDSSGAALVALSDGRKGWLPGHTIRSTMPSAPFAAPANPEPPTEE